ncbi:MAG: hypothetical protein KBT88_11465 [Gammaproteobacteria bacterium]|nr:hypothetical protein [Gammaproteobacteria bacterium]MBQ0840394.1 hypothetical protein [Gammaproteobacteria bacterium]
MIKKFFSRNKPTVERQLNSPEQLVVGDMISLKYRESLPPDLREQTLEVSSVGGYEYASGTSKEVVLKDQRNHLYFMSVEKTDGEIQLCFARKISRSELFSFIDEDSFAQLWSEHWAELSVTHTPEAFSGWLCPDYRQTVKEQEAYYYDRDCQGENLAAAEDGEELRYHECEGSDDHFGLGVEISADGSTEIFLQLYCAPDVIDQMWPHGH